MRKLCSFVLLCLGLSLSTATGAPPTGSAWQTLLYGVPQERHGPMMSVHPAPLAVEDYTITPVDVPYPGASWTVAMGINDSACVAGLYTRSTGAIGSFKHKASSALYLPVVISGAQDIQVLGLNNAGAVVGDYTHPSFESIRGFWLFRGQKRSLTVPDSLLTEATGVNDLNQIAIAWVDLQGFSHGAVYSLDTDTFTPADMPGADHTVLLGLDNEDGLYGYTLTGSIIDGAVRRAGVWSSVHVPGTGFTIVRGGNEEGLIWGWYQAGADHGFLGTPDGLGGYTFETFDVPGALSTAILGRNSQEQLVGRYELDGVHGFLATPQ